MIKTIRTPTVFLLLTLVIFGWLASWRINGTPFWIGTDSGTSISSYRPMFHLAYCRLGIKRANRNVISCIVGPAITRYAVQTRSHLQAVSVDWGAPHPTTLKGEAILAAGIIDDRTNTIEFGLLAPVCTFSKRQLSVQQVGTHAKLTLQEAYDAMSYPEPPGTHIADGTPRTHWQLSHRALIHDTLFLVTLIAWLISLTAIHRWPIWKRITPAQRRRAKHQCPTCAYALVGLTTPICPECGSTTNQPHTT